MNQIDRNGPIKQWLLLGPFPSKRLAAPGQDGVSRDGFHHDFLTPLGGESAVTPGIGPKWEPATGQPGEWLEVTAQDHGWVDASQFSGRVAYAATTVSNPVDQDVYLYLSSHGSPKLWLDGRQIMAHWQDLHPAKPWQHGVRIHLKAGTHRLVLKLDNRRGWWGFQADVIRAADHAALVAQRLEKLTLHRLALHDGGHMSITVGTSPPALDTALPVQLELRNADGSQVQRFQTKTQTPLLVPIGKFAGTVGTITASMASKETEQMDSSSPTISPNLKPVRTSAFLGDLGHHLTALRHRFTTIRPVLAQDTPGLKPAMDWLYHWLVAGADHDPADTAVLSNLTYATQVIEDAEAGENFFRRKPNGVFPCRFAGRLPDGQEVVGAYHLRLADQHWQLAPEQALALRYRLHGSGGTDLPAVFRPAEKNGREGGQKSSDPVPCLEILPRAQHHYFWRPEWLDLLHDHVSRHWNLDPGQLHVQGFSMGGGGSLHWAMAQPDRFASVTVMSTAGLKDYGGEPSERAMLTQLAGKRIWIMVGGRDRPFRVEGSRNLYCALIDVGAKVRFSIYGSRAHGGMDTVAEAEGLRQWQLNP